LLAKLARGDDFRIGISAGVDHRPVRERSRDKITNMYDSLLVGTDLVDLDQRPEALNTRETVGDLCDLQPIMQRVLDKSYEVMTEKSP
jgi:hypothetical protein